MFDTVADHNKRQGARDPEERVNVAEAAMIQSLSVVVRGEKRKRAGSHRVSLNGVRASWGIMHSPSLAPGASSITAGEETLCPHSDYH